MARKSPKDKSPKGKASKGKATKGGGALTHIDASGEARMVDVSAKEATERTAVAEGRVVMTKATLDLIVNRQHGAIHHGDDGPTATPGQLGAGCFKNLQMAWTRPGPASRAWSHAGRRKKRRIREKRDQRRLLAESAGA